MTAARPARVRCVLGMLGTDVHNKGIRTLARILTDHGVEVVVRPIVDEPPTSAELGAWIPKSERPVRKWLNTSGQSYRAIGKAKVDAAKDEEIVRWLTEDGKLVKRPVVVTSKRVLVGFDEAAYGDVFR